MITGFSPPAKKHDLSNISDLFILLQALSLDQSTHYGPLLRKWSEIRTFEPVWSEYGQNFSQKVRILRFVSQTIRFTVDETA